MSEEFRLGLDFARELDARDPLARFRERFDVRPDRIYLQANGLGLASREAEAAVQGALAAWKERAHRGWEEGERPWLTTAERLGALEAPLVGAAPDEVVATGTTTYNIHVLMATFYQPSGRRTKVLADELNFPSDIFALQSQVRLRGLDPAQHLVLVKSRDGRMLDEDDVIAAMTDEVAVLMLPSAIYRSAQVLDVARLTRAAHERGILAGFDLAHSIGVAPHALDAWDVDFALWCGYKWLNGGPGAVGGIYVNRRHFGRAAGMTGWFGVAPEHQFDPELVYHQAPTARAWSLSTPHVLSAAALEGALAVFHEAGIEAIRAKSLVQTRYLIFLADRVLLGRDSAWSLATPREDHRRGGHVALEHPGAARMRPPTLARGLHFGFKKPDTFRVAPSPLYTTYAELWQAMAALRQLTPAG
ncbi:MAG TPA: kynureninase [Methylomirabilota bacterium]